MQDLAILSYFNADIYNIYTFIFRNITINKIFW